ncbi:MAG: flagellar biosynthesis anti-sigma factor FlgM [Desulfovibrionales bacterium]|nr:MAG: flagellar biosynthesis anti-sigma factor FlgM [Desulfovibrionales bacterium]
MEIKKLIDTFRPAANRDVGNKPARGGSASEASAQQNDRVTLSAGAQTLRTALVAAQADSGVRTERVEQLRQQVETNTYQMNSRRTAEKILEHENSLWERQA